ncbi:hypothetical protein C8J56DRAFT_959221 [Mycena floridula]|nr:hypothetical protein C8J56DRAFT_959221 [Mycena floridula]
MALRIRHPTGISTIQTSDDFTVGQLQQAIYSACNIEPRKQILKTGYPPRTLTLVPELPVSSLGLTRGDAIIVEEGATSSPPAKAVTPIPRAVPPPEKPRSPLSAQSSGPEHVSTGSGYLIHRVVPDDNSCLFSAVSLVFGGASNLREIVAKAIQNDAEKYNEAILGMPPSQYTSTILKPNTWGGAIELGILAEHFGSEIASIDVETGRIDHFEVLNQSNDANRAIVIYSGIHYDAATLAPTVDAPAEWHQTLFPLQDTAILDAAKKLATQLRAKKQFTNTSTFDLKCEQCGQGLKGEKGARKHAEETGHTRFGEY